MVGVVTITTNKSTQNIFDSLEDKAEVRVTAWDLIWKAQTVYIAFPPTHTPTFGMSTASAEEARFNTESDKFNENEA